MDDDVGLLLAGGLSPHHFAARARRLGVAKATEYWKIAKHHHVKRIKPG